MKLCVYCASSRQIDKAFFDATESLAHIFADKNIAVVFGGGSVGLMGKLADVMLERNGQIQGIMPQFMKDVEWAHPQVEDFIFTETMHERKAKLLEGVDGLVALPGGSGTLEELFEAITLKRLGQFTKPIIILNVNGYYNPLKDMLDKCIKENFMHPRNADIWRFVDTPEAVIPAIEDSPEWSSDAINFALN